MSWTGWARRVHFLQRHQVLLPAYTQARLAAASLSTLEADKRFVGCNVAGFFGVLHTWGRQLQYHPHVHFVIPGGGLSKNRDRWVAANGDFLVHVRALSKMFRGKMHAALREAGLLDEVPPEVWHTPWVVHCKAMKQCAPTV